MRSMPLWLIVIIVLAGGCASPLPKGTRIVAGRRFGVDAKVDLFNLYMPPSDQPSSRPLPLVVWIHGGAWKRGNNARDRSPAMMLLQHGFAVANIDYRLSGDAKFPAQIHDCRAAVRYLRAHAASFGIDPNRIGVWGESAGGELAALLGTGGDAEELDGKDAGDVAVSCRVRAVCAWCPPTDLLEIATGRNGRTDPSMDAPGSPVGELLGGRVSEHIELARQASPVSYVARGNPPFLIFHDERDPVVPFEQSERLERALRKAGVDVKLQRVPWGFHGGWAFESAENRELVVSFFERELK